MILKRKIRYILYISVKSVKAVRDEPLLFMLSLNWGTQKEIYKKPLSSICLDRFVELWRTKVKFEL